MGQYDMKRFRKALLALTVVLGVVIVGGIWLVNSALNVMSDAVDSTLGSAHKVQVVAQKEVGGLTQNAQNGAKAALSGVERSLDALDKPAPGTKNAPTGKVADKVADSPSKPTVKKNEKDEKDSLADFGGLLSLFLNDGEDAPDPTALLTSGDKDAGGDTPASKNADDALTDMIPGANSPTVKRWMAGKYKGKESQAIDDAIEDPKIWRLIFFLSGGM
jgi:hypothetical protein